MSFYRFAHLLGWVLLSFSLSSHATEKEEMTMGRYVSLAATPLPQQVDLLSPIIQIQFPESVRTIADSLNYLLKGSGYSLLPYEKLPLAAQALMKQPLPQVDRSLGPLSLKDAVLVLIGEPFILLIDPIHRLLSLRLQAPYGILYP